MPNYQLGIIYTIRSLSSPEIYVGSTIQSLARRMSGHRRDYKRNQVLGLHKHIITDISEWYIELYELFPCNLKCELEKREGQIIREIGTLNKKIAGRNLKEYLIDTADSRREKRKQYNIDRADSRKKHC